MRQDKKDKKCLFQRETYLLLFRTDSPKRQKVYLKNVNDYLNIPDSSEGLKWAMSSPATNTRALGVRRQQGLQSERRQISFTSHQLNCW